MVIALVLGVVVVVLLGVWFVASQVRRRRAISFASELVRGADANQPSHRVRVMAGMVTLQDRAIEMFGSAAAAAIPEAVDDQPPNRGYERLQMLLSAISANAAAWSVAAGGADDQQAPRDAAKVMLRLAGADLNLVESAISMSESLGPSPTAPLDADSLRQLIGLAKGSPGRRTDESEFLPRIPGRLDALEMLGSLTPHATVVERRSTAVTAERATTAAAQRVESANDRDTDVIDLLGEISALQLDGEESSLAMYGPFETARSQYPERINGAIARFASGGERDIAVAREEFLSSVGNGPSSEQVAPDALRVVAGEFATDVLAYIEAAKAMVVVGGGRRRRRNTGVELDEALRMLDEIAEEVSASAADLGTTGGAHPLIALTERPLPICGLRRATRAYEAACGRVTAVLSDLADRQRRELAAWATGIAPAFRHAVQSIERSVVDSGEDLRAEVDAAWLTLESAGTSLELEALELLIGAVSSGSADQARLLAASAGAAATGELAAKSVPATIERLLADSTAGSLPNSQGEQLEFVHDQLLHMLVGVSAIEGVAAGMYRRGQTDGDLFKELMNCAGYRSEAREAAIAVHEAMLGSELDESSLQQVEVFAKETDRLLADRSLVDAAFERTIATDPVGASNQAGWDQVIVDLLVWTRRPDPYEAERAELVSRMGELELTDDRGRLSGTQRYLTAMEEDPQENERLVRAFADLTCEALASTRSGFLGALADHPQPTEMEIGVFTDIASDLRALAGNYLEQARSLVIAGKERISEPRSSDTEWETIERHFLAAEDAMAMFDELMWRGELLCAILALSAAPLPLVPGWRPAEEYLAVSAGMNRELAQFVVRLSTSLENWIVVAQDSVHAQAAELQDLILSSLDSTRRSRTEAWVRTTDTAREVQVEVIEQLHTQLNSEDTRLPVLASIGLAVIDAVAIENVESVTKELIPEPVIRETFEDVADQLRAAEELERRYRNAAELFAGADGILIGALAAEGIGGFSQTALGLSEVSGQLHEAGSHLFTYAHSAGFHHSVDQILPDAIHNALTNIVPGPWDVSLNADNLMASVYETSRNISGTLLMNLEKSGVSPLEAIRTYIFGDVQSTGGEFFERALHAPNVIDAIGHMQHAGELAIVDVLHGLMAHVPLITVTLTTVREIRLRREEEISLQSSIKNIAFDGATVGGGAYAAVAATGPLHLGPHFVISIPAAMLGGYLGRRFGRKFKENKVRKLQEAVTAAVNSYGTARDAMVTEFYGSVTQEMARAREEFLRKLTPAPASLIRAPKSAKGIVLDMRKITDAYLEVLRMLVSEIQQKSGGQKDVLAGIKEIEETFERAEDALKMCDVLVAEGDFIGAALALSHSSLPQYHVWGPSNRYRRTYIEGAQRLTKLEDDRRAAVGQWIERSIGTFEEIRGPLDQWLKEADSALNVRHEAAWAIADRAHKKFLEEAAHAGAH